LWQSRSLSGADASSIRPPSTSTARAAVSAASSWPEEILDDHIHQLLRQTGPAWSPFNAWVMLKGLETLSSRARQTDTAATVSVALFDHRKISRMIYPAGPTSAGGGGAQADARGLDLVAFEIKGGQAAAFRFLNALELVRMTNNLGDAKASSPIRQRRRISA